jgi:hypothetical protein
MHLLHVKRHVWPGSGLKESDVPCTKTIMQNNHRIFPMYLQEKGGGEKEGGKKTCTKTIMPNNHRIFPMLVLA